jgi:hypothetical protein
LDTEIRIMAEDGSGDYLKQIDHAVLPSREENRKSGQARLNVVRTFQMTF